MSTLPLFVYGTLKRGELRERAWPHPPLRVFDACTDGRLYDLGEYPGLRQGVGVAGGELWFIADRHMPRTLRVLDEIEGYSGHDGDLYTRRIVTVRTLPLGEDSNEFQAYTYTYNDLERLDRLEPIPANEVGIAFWSGNPDRRSSTASAGPS